MGVHPESYCHRCGGENVSWVAPSPLWNRIMRRKDGTESYDGIVCPACFAILCIKKDVASGFRLYATEIHKKKELKYKTEDGRTWNEETWLWEEA